jgi:hypothetical protein
MKCDFMSYSIGHTRQAKDYSPSFPSALIGNLVSFVDHGWSLLSSSEIRHNNERHQVPDKSARE